MEKEVVTNSSSIIFLAKLNLFHLAKNIFSRVYIPKEVISEIFAKKTPEVEIIKKEMGSFILELNTKKFLNIPVGLGEKSAISLCVEKNIGVFISDDKKARKFARSLGIETIGIIGIFLLNFKNNKISKKEAIDFLNKLIEAGYYLTSDLYKDIIQLINSS